MKQLQNNFTTPEQSRRLLELGVQADSADCYYSAIDHYTHPVIWHTDVLKFWGTKCPCWSVGRLIEIAFICSVYKVRTIDFCRNDSPMDDIIYEFENNKMDFSKLEE